MNDLRDPALHNDPESAMDKPLYDLAMVISVSGGDEQFIKKMIDLFISTVPANVQELAIGAASGNWEQVRKMAHKLKSTLDSMGIVSLHLDIRLVETYAKDQQQLSEIPLLVKNIDTVISRCIDQLRIQYP